VVHEAREPQGGEERQAMSTALARCKPRPHPERVVDMNEFRRDVRVLNHAVEAFLEAFWNRPILIEPRTGKPTLSEYDRVSETLRAFGVMNARIDWDGAQRRWVLG
jgi:hypothetical protein